MFGAVDWNYAAGAPVRRGKSVEELGDAGWARERERIAHLQQIQQLHQLQLQQQQVGYPGYGVVPPGHPQGPVMVPSPGEPLPFPGWPAPVHGGMMVHAGGPLPPPGHVPAQWPVQWGDQAQIRQDNVGHQPSWQYDNQHRAAFQDKSPQSHDVYFHPGSENGHLDVRISEWKGKHCFYQGPVDNSQQDNSRVAQEKDNNDLRTQDGYGKCDEDRKRRENDHNSERYDYRSHRDVEQYDHKDRYKYRDNFDRKCDERYYSDQEDQYYDSRKHRTHDVREHDRYEYEDHHDHKDTYDRRDNYRDSDRYYDRDREYYDTKESHRYREKEYYQRREDDRYYDEQKRKDHYSDRHAEDRYDRRDNISKDRDVYNRWGEETYTSKGRGQYDSELDDRGGYKERNHHDRYKDTDDDRRDEHFDHRRRDNYKTREHYERRDVDHYDREDEYHYESRGEGERSHHRPRDRYRDLRSVSVEEYPKEDRKTHCEEWVEQQNQKLALREMRSFEDPVIYRRSDEQEKGYESSAGDIGSKRGRKPVYVGSLDRNSFYRKTAPSSLQKSQFATSRRPNQGKLNRMLSCERVYSTSFVCTAWGTCLCRGGGGSYHSTIHRQSD